MYASRCVHSLTTDKQAGATTANTCTSHACTQQGCAERPATAAGCWCSCRRQCLRAKQPTQPPQHRDSMQCGRAAHTLMHSRAPPPQQLRCASNAQLHGSFPAAACRGPGLPPSPQKTPSANLVCLGAKAGKPYRAGAGCCKCACTGSCMPSHPHHARWQHPCVQPAGMKTSRDEMQGLATTRQALM